MPETYSIDGITYSEEDLVAILRDQISRIPEYSRFADAVIEFCYKNNHDEVFFYVSRDNGEDMMVKFSQNGNIYWDWKGQVMDDE